MKISQTYLFNKNRLCPRPQVYFGNDIQHQNIMFVKDWVPRVTERETDHLPSPSAEGRMREASLLYAIQPVVIQNQNTFSFTYNHSRFLIHRVKF
jgi:hypothetical protein